MYKRLYDKRLNNQFNRTSLSWLRFLFSPLSLLP